MTTNYNIKVLDELEKIKTKIKEYLKDGFKISIEDKRIIVKYKNRKYLIEITKEKNNFYWKVTPFCASYFTTNIENTNSFDITLFAIQENDLFRKENCIILKNE